MCEQPLLLEVGVLSYIAFMKVSVLNILLALLVIATSSGVQAKPLTKEEAKQVVFCEADSKSELVKVFAIDQVGFVSFVEIMPLHQNAKEFDLVDGYVVSFLNSHRGNYLTGQPLNLASDAKEKANTIRGSPLTG